MDSIDPGTYLASLMAGASKPASGTNSGATPSKTDAASIDQAILSLAAQQPTTTDSSVPDQNQAAAAAADNAAQSKQQYLHVGPWTTSVPIPHWLDNGLAGGGGRVVQLGQWAGQPFGMQPDPLTAATASDVQNTTAGKVGSGLTDVALTAPIGGAATAGLARLGGIGARIAGSTLGNAAVQGAVQGALTSQPGDRLQGAALGAVLSPVLPAIAGAAGKVATGLTRTPEAQALLDRGMQLTPGQMNPTGKVVNRLEQAFTHLPLVGGQIANARAAGPVQYARSMLEDALAPGAQLASTSHDFNDLVAEGQRGFDQAYDQTLRSTVPGGGFQMAPKILNTTGPDVPLNNAFTALANKPRLGLTATQRSSMGQQLQDQLNETIAVAKRGGGLQADDLQALRSAIRDTARDVSPVDNASRAQKQFWNEAQQTVTQALESQLPAATSQALQDIDQQYGKFSIVKAAAKSAKDQPGGPTPAQFSTAISQATNPSAYATGGGWNRNLSKAAREVFQSTIPHTGATGAGVVAPVMHSIEGAGAALLGAHNPLALAGIGAGLGAVGGAYSRPGLRALAGQTAWQKQLQRIGGLMGPAGTEALSRYARAGALDPALQGGLLNAPPQMAGLLSQ
ncbi:MAG: hypothetical protein ACRD3Q_02260 [Terriglobales bacterium]